MHRLILSRQNSGRKGKTFLYRFAVDSPTLNHYRISHLGPEVRGVCHADELSYLFKNINIDVPERDTIEFKSIQRFVSFFFVIKEENFNGSVFSGFAFYVLCSHWRPKR